MIDLKEFSIPEVDEETEKKLLGIRCLLLRGEKREAVLTSILVAKGIKDLKTSGKRLSSNDIEKIKFAYDPIFKQEVINKIHRDCDREYSQNIKKCESKIKKIEKSIADEIKRIEASRWENIYGQSLRYNVTEGKLLMNDTYFPFSSIKGAEINMNEIHHTEVIEDEKSKKHASVGGAIAGGLLFGAPGAIIGGTVLGKKTHHNTVNTKSIAMCNHIGVIVDLDGFKSEIILLSKTVEQNSDEFRETLKDAHKIISKLQYISKLPVPESFLLPEEEKSVVDLKEQLASANSDLREAIANVPKYEIPSKYL